MSKIWTPPKIAGEDARQAAKEAVEERMAILQVDAGMSPEEATSIAETSAREGMHPLDELVVNNRFINEWRASIGRSTDASGILVVFAGIGLLSALCHKFFFKAPRETYLNLFLFILGPSSSPRKTTVLDMTADYLAEVAPSLVLPNEFTPEALWSCLAEQSHGIIFSRELNAWLDSMLGKDYNKGLASSLGNIYDHTSRCTRQTKKDGFVVIENPVVTILGAGVDAYLINKLKEMDMVSGFWPRVTLVQLPLRKGQLYRSPGDFVLDYPILEKLQAIIAQEGGELGYTKINPMREEYATLLQREAAELDNSNLASGYIRLEWILVKVAALLQLADNPTSREIEPEAFCDALTLVNYVKQGLPGFYGEHLRPSEEVKLAAWALRFIKKWDENGTAWVPYRDILQNAHSDAGKLRAALTRLLETEEIETQPIPAPKTGGKASSVYRRGH